MNVSYEIKLMTQYITFCATLPNSKLKEIQSVLKINLQNIACLKKYASLVNVKFLTGKWGGGLNISYLLI